MTFRGRVLQRANNRVLDESHALLTEKKQKLTAPGIPRRSPIQVLTRPDPAWLPRSDEIGHVQGGMAVNNISYPPWCIKTDNFHLRNIVPLILSPYP